jgi:hypothetical protein
MTLAMFISVVPGTSSLYHGGISKPVILSVQCRARIERRCDSSLAWAVETEMQPGTKMKRNSKEQACVYVTALIGTPP